jgi:hypothetical protein
MHHPAAIRRKGASHAKAFVFLFAAVAARTADAAPAVEVVRLGCTDGVHLVAQRAPVSDVLMQLSRATGFRVEGSDHLSSVVTIDAVQPTQRLLATILRDENNIVKEEADPRCPGRTRVTMVWIIEKTNPATGVAGAPVPTPAYVNPEAKANDDLYRQGHGMAP